MYVIVSKDGRWWVDIVGLGTTAFSKARVFSSLTEARTIAHPDELVLTLEEAQAIMIARAI